MTIARGRVQEECVEAVANIIAINRPDFVPFRHFG